MISAQGLYDPRNEHDSCGVGFVAHIKGSKSHEIVSQGLLILRNLDHRGAVGRAGDQTRQVAPARSRVRVGQSFPTIQRGACTVTESPTSRTRIVTWSRSGPNPLVVR